VPKALRIPVVILVAVLFVGYYWTAVRHWHLMPLPDYAVEEVDLLGGKTPAAWADDETFQNEHLRHLDRTFYQPTAEGLTLPGGRRLGPGEVLTRADFRALIEGGTTGIALRNPSAIREIAKKGYKLRNPVADPEAGLDYHGGERLAKPVIDDLLRAGMDRVAVVGAGEMISIQLGTMMMVILVFLALVAALQNALWDPVLALIDERRRTVEEGEARARANRTDRVEIEEEGRRLNANVRREYMKDLTATQREAGREADRILHEARDEAQRLRQEAHREIEREIEAAAEVLEKQRSTLAREVASAVLGRETTEPA
jgi:F-type H+-transporting ATPase subunit b